MANDPKSAAIEALFLTFADKLPALLTARDAVRFARRRCNLGPYNVTAGTVTINGESFAVSAGAARTAAQVASDFAGSVSFTASAEGDGAGARLVFTATAAPARDAPSVLMFDGDADTLGDLGLRPVESDVAEVSIADPGPRLIDGEPSEIEVIDRPWIFTDSAIDGPYRGGSIRQRIHVVNVRLAVWVPGDPGFPIRTTLERAREIDRALCAAVRAGDSRGPYYVGGEVAGSRVIQAKPASLSASPKAWEFRGKTSTIPVGLVSPEFEILIQATET